ncbi:MAG TPA: DUF1778 domain-containing protein [Thermomicrobiales bacterium]|nr:DUF1778 domain-containing protein [Thermomicrobiales bacterium]
MSGLDATDDVAIKRREADAEFVEWMRVQFERIMSGQRRPSESEDPLDRTFFELNDDEFDRFQELLENPPEPSEGLRKVMARKARWE